VWAALEQHYAPRPIDGKHVVATALYNGIEQQLFRVSVDGNEPTNDTSGLNVEGNFQGIELVRPEAEKKTRSRFLTIDVRNVQPNQLSKIMLGAINPLKGAGATVTLQLVIDADAPDGIEPEVIELTIKETFKQLGLTADYQQLG
jgi:hypothetical protein